MNSRIIRQKFFEFFNARGHERVSSSSLIPAQDPTLLFANAGMNQFKDVFLGREKRNYARAVTIQKCVRAGGKHNDLDNVGFTSRHLTFFEMMGNFSFGDYFKKEAIEFAWGFLTLEMGINPDHLYATVYHEDDESYNIWHTHIGLPKARIYRLGASDNFWQMGDTGPCGPCTEILVDRGSSFGCGKKNCAPGCPCDRFLEIWNLVFMQYNRQPDGTDVPLKQTGVDTGMGLERLCVVMQGVDTVFNTDLFVPLIQEIEQLTGIAYAYQKPQTKAAFHVLADHIRSTSFLIADGCAPSNEGRGYVLRKIIRRAALFAQKLSSENIFPQLVDALVASMGDIYPELVMRKKVICSVITHEVEQFATNLVRGQTILQRYFTQAQAAKVISGSQAFKLYDTYGFPLEITKIMAQERGYIVDEQGFQAEMELQRAQSGKKVKHDTINLPENITTTFTGYEQLEVNAIITALIVDNELVSQVPVHQSCWVITDRSPFYVEGGGQVSDHGWLIVDEQEFAITDLKKMDGAIAVQVKAAVPLRIGEAIVARVDKHLRLNTMKNHTATHLLQAALIQLLGKQIKQSGSLVHPDYLRFDFTCHEPLSQQDIVRIEQLVNERIMDNIPLCIEQTTYQDALNRGVIAFFGEKYNPESVRIVQVPGFSAELCGGTHVRATGDIGCFKITDVTALSAGNRRIIAVTGPRAVQLFQESFGTVKQLTQEFKVTADKVLVSVTQQKEQVKGLQTQVKQLKQQVWRAQLPSWRAQEEHIGNVPCFVIQAPGYSAQELKEIATDMAHHTPGFYCFMSNGEAASTVYATVSAVYAPTVDMASFKAWLTATFGIRGGGSAHELQGGGPLLPHDSKERIIQRLHGLLV